MGGIYKVEETRYVECELELDEKTLLFLALEAHKKNITLNDYMIELFKDYARERQKTL